MKRRAKGGGEALFLVYIQSGLTVTVFCREHALCNKVILA